MVWRTKQLHSNNKFGGLKNYVPFRSDELTLTLCVDCTHRSCPQITHHLKIKGQKQLADLKNRGDSSTDGVLNAIKNTSIFLTQNEYVTSNHFDIDSFLSVWCALNPSLAVQYEKIIREIARVGDFRELKLDEPWQLDALRICCWMNSVERDRFYRPFESQISAMDGEEDCQSKFDYFLSNFCNVLQNPNDATVVEDSKVEFDRVVCEYDELNNQLQHSNIKFYDHLGLVYVQTKMPMHYYSLFSVSRNYDIMLMSYDDNRYEIELKYTTFVDIDSRPTLPRVEMIELAKYLNEIEHNYFNHYKSCQNETIANYYKINSDMVNHSFNSNESQLDTNADKLLFEWRSDRIIDSGPILRLDYMKRGLNKMQRYGHPYERPIYSSLIEPDIFHHIVISYFSYAYQNIKKKKDWNWDELHTFNNGIDWKSTCSIGSPLWLDKLPKNFNSI
jgi:hypothetical protein